MNEIATIIIAVIGSSSLTSVVNYLINVKFNKVTTQQKIDEMIAARLLSYEERITKLEKLSCYKEDCKKRI